jgi:Mce-associated membrane protein
MSEDPKTIDEPAAASDNSSRRAPRIPALRILRRWNRFPAADRPATGDAAPAPTPEAEDRDATTETDSGGADPQPHASTPTTNPKRLTRVLTFVVLPVVAFVLAGAAAYLKYDQSTLVSRQIAAAESVQAAKGIATEMLSYAPATAEATLTKAADRMAGTFRDSFLSLVKDVVAPGARQKDVAATVTVPAAAVSSTTPTKATVVLFIDQTITIGGGTPTNTASVVQVNLEKVNGQWKLTAFDPK